MIKLYGIQQCDTVKKARKWLDHHGITYQFHDFRTDGLTVAMLEEFVEQASWETLLNQRSTSWRQLSDEQKSELSQTKAVNLMLETPTLIKRPVLQSDSGLMVGFSVENYEKLLR
jgi:arsenate reductase (glutaredoxin)